MAEKRISVATHYLLLPLNSTVKSL